MDTRAGLDVSEKRKVSCPTRNRTAISRFSSPEPSLHTYYAIPAPSVSMFYNSFVRGGRYHAQVAKLAQWSHAKKTFVYIWLSACSTSKAAKEISNKSGTDCLSNRC